MATEPIEREKRIQTLCLLIVCAVAIGAALHWLAPVMIPFVLSLFIVFGLSLFMDMLIRRLHFPRSVALATSILVAGLIFLMLILVVTGSVQELAGKANAYQSSISRLLNRAASSLPLEEWGVSKEDIKTLYEVPVESVGGMLLGTTNAIVDILSKSTLVFIFVIFLLIGSPRQSVPKSSMWLMIESKIKKYLVAKTAISAATGLLVGSVLYMLGVDLALAFGFFAFLLNFIPSLGSIIATLLPVPIVLVGPEASAATVILVILIPGAIQLTIGNFLEPMILGDSLELHPVAILMALIFWGMLWGIIGMFLAVPITAILKILFAKHKYTRVLSELLEGNMDVLQREKEPRLPN